MPNGNVGSIAVAVEQIQGDAAHGFRAGKARGAADARADLGLARAWAEDLARAADAWSRHYGRGYKVAVYEFLAGRPATSRLLLACGGAR